MTNYDRLVDLQTGVIETAITKYEESPQVCSIAADFAAQQKQQLMHYDPRGRLFFLTDGEAYTASYIVKHMKGVCLCEIEHQAPTRPTS